MASPRKRFGYKLVLVEWDDAALPVSGWTWLDEYETAETVPCVSVGFLIAQTRTSIALAPNLGDLNQEREQACGVIRIPRRMVLKMTELRVSSS